MSKNFWIRNSKNDRPRERDAREERPLEPEIPKKNSVVLSPNFFTIFDSDKVRHTNWTRNIVWGAVDDSQKRRIAKHGSIKSRNSAIQKWRIAGFSFVVSVSCDVFGGYLDPAIQIGSQILRYK